MSNVSAGIGRGQMEVLQDRVNKRRSNFEFYRKELAGFEGISVLEEPQGYFSNRWLSTIHVDPVKTKGITKKSLYNALLEDNIESRPLWKPMHMQPVFAGQPFYGNGISEELFRNGLCLPSGSNLTEEDLQRVLKGISKLF